MSEDTKPTIVMNSDTEAEADSTVEREAEFILVEQNSATSTAESELTEPSYHLWLRGTHYVDVGTADEVNAGDMFLFLTPEYFIQKVTEVNVEPPEGEHDTEWVKATFWDWQGNNTDSSSSSQEFSVGRFTGLGDKAPMGYTGPPVKIEPASEYVSY